MQFDSNKHAKNFVGEFFGNCFYVRGTRALHQGRKRNFI